MFFKKKNKEVPTWELQNLYEAAIKRLSDMEAEPEKYTRSSMVEDLMSQYEFTKNRMEGIDPLSDEWHTLNFRAETIKVEIEKLEGKDPLLVQRDYVQRLADQKLDWEKEHNTKPMTKGDKWYVTLTAVGLALPIIGEHFGRFWKHVTNRIELPWKKIR